MSEETEEDLEKYLNPTVFCDSNHQEISDKAEELTQNDITPKEKALSIFHFMRDQIKFMMAGNDKASDTLRNRFGDCGTKANLQVALLRAAGIPARYHIVALRKGCIKGIVSETFYQATPDVIPHHPWCECYLSGEWISCDTLLDKRLINSVYKKNIFTKDEIPTIEWDGKNNLNTMTYWIVEDKGTFHSLDKLYLESQKEAENLPIPKEQLEMMVRLSNEYTDSLREG